MQDEPLEDDFEYQKTRRGRTLIELNHQTDGTWTATQLDVDVVGTGETAPTAALDYCRQIAENQHATDE